MKRSHKKKQDSTGEKMMVHLDEISLSVPLEFGYRPLETCGKREYVADTLPSFHPSCHIVEHTQSALVKCNPSILVLPFSWRAAELAYCMATIQVS
jgi:hypothetical protein